jgi:hypothetical protein
MLAGLAEDLVESLLGETVDVNGEHFAKLVQQDPAELFAMASGGGTQRRIAGQPQRCVCRNLRE